MLKILLHTNSGQGLVLIDRLQSEGHDVTLFFKGLNSKFKVMDGIVKKVSSLEEGIKTKPDVVVFDYVTESEDAEKLKKMGIPVFGAGKFNDDIELKRDYGLEVMQSVGIDIPETIKCKSFDEAIDYVKNNQKRYVVKINDNDSCYSSYVSSDVDDMLNMLEHFKNEKVANDKKGLILQEFIDGFEISIEGWHCGKSFLEGLYNNTIEEKKAFNDNLGPTVGSSGSVLLSNKDINPIFIDIISKMNNILIENDYRGAIDINFIFGYDGVPKALEFCGRIGYVAIEPFMEFYPGDFGELLCEVANGGDNHKALMNKKVIGVSLTAPPFPLDLPMSMDIKQRDEISEILSRKSNNLRITGWEDFSDSCYFSDVWLDNDRNLRVMTMTGNIAAVCATGDTINKAQELVYDKLDKIKLPNKSYRTDIGDRAVRWINGSWKNKK